MEAKNAEFYADSKSEDKMQKNVTKKLLSKNVASFLKITFYGGALFSIFLADLKSV